MYKKWDRDLIDEWMDVWIDTGQMEQVQVIYDIHVIQVTAAYPPP